MPTPEQVTAAVTNYELAYRTRDRAVFLALFSSDAVQIDPVPAPPNVGHEAIGVFFDNAMNMAPDLTLFVDRTIVCANEAAVNFHVEATLGGTKMGFSGVDIFTVNDEGLITAISAYWDPSAIAPI
jgi:ketosteroid isomerase-like protein